VFSAFAVATITSLLKDFGTIATYTEFFKEHVSEYGK